MSEVNTLDRLTLGEIAHDLRAKDVMQYGVITVEQTAPLHRAVSLLIDKDISGLAVVHDKRLVGIIADKDLLRLLKSSEYLPGRVEDYMTPTVVSFGVEDRLTDICQCLIDNVFRRVPILYQDKLAGMMTRSDLIAAFLKRYHEQHDARASQPDPPGLIAEDVMTHGLHTLYPDAPLVQAMETIVRHHITGIPIVTRQWDLAGIVTEKDLLLAMNLPLDPAEEPVERFMTRNVISFPRSAGLDEVCDCLIQQDFHRVPILDGTKLAGVISRSDVLRARIASFKI